MKPRAQRLERLSDANPVFLGHGGPGVTHDGQPVPRREGIGLQFDCPIHEECWTAVIFENPLDGARPPDGFSGQARWQRTGDTFDTLTLAPSIRCVGKVGECRWHGFIRNGRFEHCGDAR